MHHHAFPGGPLGKISFRYGGGKQQSVSYAPAPMPAPPVANTSAEVARAGADLRQQDMLKKNIRETVKAGDTGGFMPMAQQKPGKVIPFPGSAPAGKVG